MKRFLSIIFALAVFAGGFHLLQRTLEVREQAMREEAAVADVIVVLGAAEYNGRPSPVFKSRLDHAYNLFARKLAPRIVTTGGAGGERVHTEAQVGREYLASRGVPVEMIYMETQGETTAQSAAASAEIIKRMGWRTCIVVSDGYHLYRAKRMMESHGVRCLGSPRPAKDIGAFQAGWLYFRQAVGDALFQLGLSL